MNSLIWVIVGALGAALPLLILGLSLHRRYVGIAVDAATSYLRQQCNEMSGELEIARTRADNYFQKIDDATRQRDIWVSLHHAESIGHGNAQNLMMEQIEILVRKLENVKGAVRLHLGAESALSQRVDVLCKTRLNPVLEQVRAEHQATYVQPAMAQGEPKLPS